MTEVARSSVCLSVFASSYSYNSASVLEGMPRGLLLRRVPKKTLQQECKFSNIAKYIGSLPAAASQPDAHL